MGGIGPDQRASDAEVIHDLYAALNARSATGFVALLDPQVQWQEPVDLDGDGEAVSGRFGGRAAVIRGVLVRLEQDYASSDFSVQRLIADGDGTTVALGRLAARTHDGHGLLADFAHIWELRDGRVIRFRDFHDRTLHVNTLQSQLRQAFTATTDALLAALEARDGYTAGHARSIASLAVEVGRRVGLDDRRLEDLRLGAIFHDVGKLAVPDSVLHKPGELSEGERAIVREHPLAGERILRPVGELARVGRIVRHHHERWDGTGYPDGLAGEEIPLEARIVAAVDAYHAMTSDRPYRRALSETRAMRELRAHAGAQFDPTVIDELLHVLGDRVLATA